MSKDEIFSKISGTGSYLPEKVVTNIDLEKQLDTSDEWIAERTGIRKRHIAAEYETASSMAVEAAKKAIEAADIDPNEIDLIIVGTCTPDRFFPSTACFVQKALSLPQVMAFDLSAACSGFVYGLSVADQFIKNGSAKHVLVIGTEVMSRTIDWEDRRICILFGDGAGAAILSASDEPGVYSTHCHADGKYADLLYYPNDEVAPSLKGETPFLQMKGREVFQVAVKELANMVDETLTENQLEKTDIDWLVPHQANLRIIKATAKKLSLPMDRVIVTVDEHANTSAASIPLALDAGIRSGRIKRGETLLLEGFGGGMAWGSVLVRY